MTNPNWWDEEPYISIPRCNKQDDCPCHDLIAYNIPAIIAEVEKRGETRVTNVNGINQYCGVHWDCEKCLKQCNACKAEFQTSGEIFNFCPHCGAKIIWS